MPHVIIGAAASPRDSHGISVVVITFPDAGGEADLLEVVGATDFLGFFLGGSEGRQEHGRKNRDDRDDDEEFDKRERFLLFLVFHNLFVFFVFVRVRTRDSRRIAATVNRISDSSLAMMVPRV